LVSVQPPIQAMDSLRFNGVAGGILFDEAFVARLFDAGGNFV